MLNPEIEKILDRAETDGWVLEPEAKRLLKLAGISTPEFVWARQKDEALSFARRIGYPVVAKVVSPQVVHKTEAGGVAVGIPDDAGLEAVFDRFRHIDGFEGVLVEESLGGVELIVGAKVDYQFGPVVLLGIGGTGVEIYQDVSVRMAPLEPRDVGSMINCLKGRRLILGYRGSPPANLDRLVGMMVDFSSLVMQFEGRFTSIDLNPVFATPRDCVVADARIMLREEPAAEGTEDDDARACVEPGEPLPIEAGNSCRRPS
jgi:succinyl-CoA synthetase beta subunit